jgi:hypothetical protein
MEIRTADWVGKQRVASEHRRLVQHEGGALSRVTGRMERTERRRSEPYGFTVRHRRERKPGAVLWRHQEHRASLLRQFGGAREVVGMEMGVDHMRNRPPMLSSDLQVDAGRERWVDHRRLITRSDDVRQTPLPRAPHLNDTHRRIRKRDFSGIPGEAPCLHPARQRTRIEPRRVSTSAAV